MDNPKGDARRTTAALLIAGLMLAPAAAQAEDPMLLVDEPGLEVRLHLQAGVNAVAEQNLFWNFADTFAPTSGFDSDTRWLEDRHAMPDREGDKLFMRFHRGTDIDEVELAGRQHVCRIVPGGNTEFGRITARPFRIMIADRNDIGSIRLRPSVKLIAGKEAATNEQSIERLCHGAFP